MKTKEYEATVAANTPEGYPYLVAGWPDEEHGYDWCAYIDWARDEVDNVYEGEDVGPIQTFDQFKAMRRDENPDRDDLGFSHENCELCGAMPGDRYAVTAFPEDVANAVSEGNYITLMVCDACLQYIVNNELPYWLED